MARVFKDQRDSAQIDHASNFTEGEDLIPEFNFLIAAEAGWPRSNARPRMTYNRQMTNDVISNAFFMVQNAKVRTWGFIYLKLSCGCSRTTSIKRTGGKRRSTLPEP